MNKHIELAKKLAALAAQGVGGEKINANKLLDKLMAKHGITAADIDGEQVQRYWLEFPKRFDDLFTQLKCRVVGFDASIWLKKSHREGARINIIRGVDCTTAQFMELQWLMKVYFDLWDEELSMLHYAFTIKHDLFDPNKEGRDLDELTPEERAKVKRASLMAETLETRHIQKQIQ